VKEFDRRAGAALVVGASGGIGAAISTLLLERGSRVAMTYRRPSARVKELCEQPGTRAYQVDLNDADRCRSVVEEAVADFGALHTLVYAAGPHVPMRYVATIPPEQFRQQMLDDAVGCFNIVQPALPHLREVNGCVVAVTTVATARFPARDSLSSAPKGAVEALVRAIAFEEGRFGVRANCVGPGIMADGMTERLVASGDFTPEVVEATRRMIPMRRLGAALDVAEAVCFLASDRAGYISGQKLDVDGGYAI
jgi:NAD(P)-dependent dehydrogenase (short-subunit alcohol dehydrogenase family)